MLRLPIFMSSIAIGGRWARSLRSAIRSARDGPGSSFLGKVTRPIRFIPTK